MFVDLICLLTSQIVFWTIVKILKNKYSLKEIYDSNVESIGKILDRREMYLSISGILLFILLMILSLPFSYLENLGVNKNLNSYLYLFSAFLILTTIFYIIFKMIDYSEKKEKLKDSFFKSIEDYSYDKDYLIKDFKGVEEIFSVGKKIKIRKNLGRRKVALIFNIFFLLSNISLIVFFLYSVISSIDFNFKKELSIQMVKGNEFVYFSIFLIFIITYYFGKEIITTRYIDLDNNIIVQKNLFFIEKIINFKEGRTVVKKLYYKNLYVGHKIYVFSPYYGYIHICTTKDLVLFHKITFILETLTGIKYSIS